MENQIQAKYGGYQEKSLGFYSEDKKKILIIKLGAMGDVLRTTPLLLGLKKKYPESLIFWLTQRESFDLLKNNPLIDKILIYNQETLLRIMFEKFDFLFSLEIEPSGTLVANLSKAEKKYGYFFDETGITGFYNKGAEYYLNVAFDDELKRKNKKSYQEMMFETAELKFSGEKYLLEITEEIQQYGEMFLKEKGIEKRDKILGINISAGKRWPSKKWSHERILELIGKMKGYKILLLGGPEEKEELSELKRKAKTLGFDVLANNPENSLDEFIGIIRLCSGIISTDSLGLHIALALRKKTVALFFSTLENEITGDSLIKIQSRLNQKYFYTNEESEELANSIAVDEVVKAIQELKI